MLFLVNTMFAQVMIVEDDYGLFQYKKISNINKITFGVPPAFSVCGDLLLYEGKYYETVQINTQCWFKENLNVGTKISSVGNQIDNITIEKYCYNDLESNCNTYGGLYQWDEAMQYVTTEGVQGICPTGWHLPTYVELNTLKTNVIDGNSLKAVGQGTGSGIGTNSVGFSALISGYLTSGGGSFYDIDYSATYWSSSVDGYYASGLGLYARTSSIGLGTYEFYSGYSIRCLKN